MTDRCKCGDEAFYHLMNGKKVCVKVGCECRQFRPADAKEEKGEKR